jgi:hypothetical protein
MRSGTLETIHREDLAYGHPRVQRHFFAGAKGGKFGAVN